VAAQPEGSPSASERSRIDLDAGTFANFEHGWSLSWSPEFWDYAANGDGRLLMHESTPTGKVNIQAQTRDLRHADDWASDCLALPASDQAFAPIAGATVGVDGRPQAGQTAARIWMILQDPAVGILYVDCRPLEGGSTYLLISLFAQSEEAFVTAAPELMRMLASLRTSPPAPGT
jgi:hypothetical protein